LYSRCFRSSWLFSISGQAQVLPISGSASLVQASSWCQRHVHVHLHGVEVGNVDVGVVVVVLVVVVVPIVVVAIEVVGHVDGGVHHREHEAQKSDRRQLTKKISG
jgi:hypothetical protein